MLEVQQIVIICCYYYQIFQSRIEGHLLHFKNQVGIRDAQFDRSRLGAGPLGATSQSVSVMLLTAYMGILPTSEWKAKGNAFVVESGAPYGR